MSVVGMGQVSSAKTKTELAVHQKSVPVYRQMLGHFNGIRYKFKTMTNNLLFIRVATGFHEGRCLLLPQIPQDPGGDDFPVQDLKEFRF